MKVVVLGGGPGGYVCAIRLAQNGADVTIVEKERFGGTCLNVGCIPTKALLHSAELYRKIQKEAPETGIQTGEIKIDWKKVQERRRLIVEQLVGGVDMLLTANGVKKAEGRGRLIDRNSLAVTKKDGAVEKIDFDALVLAVGSAPKMIPIPGIDLPGVLSSNEVLSLPEIPKRLCIIGGGVIGCEIASAYSAFGSEVTVLEALPEMLSTLDRDVVDVILKNMHASGIKTHVSASVKGIEKQGNQLKVLYNDTELMSDIVLMATGRSPLTNDIGLEEAGICMERGYIKVDRPSMRTNVAGIYAIGDCCGGIQLAHAASAEGMNAADVICGKEPSVNMKSIPSCVYTSPEAGCVGMTQEQAEKAGYCVQTGLFSLAGNGKSLIEGDTSGFVKIVADRKNGEILGIHIVGPRATDIIAEGTLAINLECTVDELISSVHPHPTVSEAVTEAAHSVFGNPIHLPPQ